MSEEKNAAKVSMEKLKLNLKELQQITGGRKTDDRLREYECSTDRTQAAYRL